MNAMLPDRSRVSSSLAVTSTSDTQTFSYPAGTGPGSFGASGDHKITGRDFTELLSRQGHITITFGASSISVVNNTERTFKAGTVAILDLDLAGRDDSLDTLDPTYGVFNLSMARIYLGAPITADVDGICTVEITEAAGNLPIDGARATDGVATLDVPRNVTLTVATTNQSGATFTITGTDVFGNAMVEDITGPNNNTVAGKKAFKTVTTVYSNAALATNGVSVGFGDVLGLPVFLESVGDVLRELEDGVAPTAGTLVAGVQTTPSATTGDVRGTYDPNSACNGSKVFELLVALESKSYRGAAQYAG